MIINARIAYKLRVMFQCDLSHENFISFIQSLHELGFDTEVTDSGEFNYFSETDHPDVNVYWVDEDTVKDVIEIVTTLKKEKC